MAEVGLNLLQLVQQELNNREGARSSLGVGFRLHGLEERIMNAEAVNRNGRVWKFHHAVSALSALTPESRERMERQRRKLLERKDAKKLKDENDPAMNPRSEERWEIHTAFPRTVHDFKQLQFHPERVRSLLDFYNVKVYRPDFRQVNVNPADRGIDVSLNMETCLEELAMHWGIDWHKIGGLSLPLSPVPSAPSNFAPSPSPTVSDSYSNFTSHNRNNQPPQQGILRRSTGPQYFSTLPPPH